jgi:hypothetical protein
MCVIWQGILKKSVEASAPDAVQFHDRVTRGLKQKVI